MPATVNGRSGPLNMQVRITQKGSRNQIRIGRYICDQYSLCGALFKTPRMAKLYKICGNLDTRYTCIIWVQLWQSCHNVYMYASRSCGRIATNFSLMLWQPCHGRCIKLPGIYFHFLYYFSFFFSLYPVVGML